MLLERDASVIFSNAVILDAGGPFARSLRVKNGKIDALNMPPQKDDFVFDLDGGLILPGLINAHDHLGLNNFGRIKYRDVYPNAHEWSLDIEARFETDLAITAPHAVPIPDRLFIGGIKNLLAGVTTVCHHDPWHYSLQMDFPVRVARPFGYCHSLQRGGDIRRSFCKTPYGAPWIIHLAEGTDANSAHELDTLDTLGCLQANTVVVHGVGLTPAQRCNMIERGAALVWCPSSNFFLLGQTAEVGEFARAGRVALGTDSRLTGERDIWYELRTAHSTRHFKAQDLFRLVTCDAAHILRLSNLGVLDIGTPADLVIFPAMNGDPFDSLLRCNRADMQLVMLGGKPLYGALEFKQVFSQARVATQAIRVDGREKLLAQKIARRLKQNSIGEPGVEIEPSTDYEAAEG